MGDSFGRLVKYDFDRNTVLVYGRCMSRTNINIDDEACTEVMRRYRLPTKREAVNFALRALAAKSLNVEEARQLRGSGWEGDLDEMRSVCIVKLTNPTKRYQM